MAFSKYVWDIDQEDKETLFETAEFYFSRKKDILGSLSIDKDVYNEHLEGELDAIGTDTAERLYQIIHTSEPRYSVEDAGQYVEREFNHVGEMRVELDDDFQRFLFEPYNIEELQDLTGKSEQQLVKYRNNSAKSIPKEIYALILEEAGDKLQARPNPSGDVHLRGSYNTSNSTDQASLILEDAKLGEMKIIHHDTEILESILEPEIDEAYLGFLKDRYKKDLEKIKKVGESDFKSTVKPEGMEQSRSFKALNEMGLLEEAATGNRYRIPVELEYFDILEQKLDSVKKELIEILKEQDEQGNKITRERFDSSKELPDAHEYEKNGHFGSWPNALWHAGIKPSKERYDEDAVVEHLLDITHEKSKIPTLTEFAEAPDTPSMASVEKHFDDAEDLLEESGLYTRKKIQESSDKGDKYYVMDRDKDSNDEDTDEEDFEILS